MALEPSGYEIAGSEKFSHLSWSAIFSGLFVFLGIEIMFALLGSGIGLSSLSMQPSQQPGSDAAWGAGIYILVTTLIAFFIGGYTATRLSGFRFRATGVLAGLTVWGFATTVSLLGVGASLGSVATKAAELTGLHSPAIVGEVTIVPRQAQNRIQPQSRMTRQQTQNQVRQEAGVVKRTVAGGAWWAFVTVILGGIASILGAMTGASPFQRRTGASGLSERRAA